MGPPVPTVFAALASGDSFGLLSALRVDGAATSADANAGAFADGALDEAAASAAKPRPAGTTFSPPPPSASVFAAASVVAAKSPRIAHCGLGLRAMLSLMPPSATPR